MTTTTNVNAFAAVAVWGSTSSSAANAVNNPALNGASNPTNCHTEKVGGKVCFENDNYRITCGDDNTVHITNKHTGETYEAWGDPHMKIDGKQAFDFWGTTTLQLEDGTKVTIETTPWAHNPEMTLSSKVTITNGEYGVQISGVDTNQVGDLQFEEAPNLGCLTDALVADGNMLHENPSGAGFLGIDGNGRIRAVDQQYINETDLQKGGAMQAKWADAMRQLSGLMAVAFIGGFLSSLAGQAAGGGASEGAGAARQLPMSPKLGDDDSGAALMMVMSRNNQNMSFFAAAAAWN